MQNYIVGLDFGSNNIKCAVGEIKRDNKLSLINMLKMPASGIRKGAVEDIGEAIYSLNNIISEVKKISKNSTKNVYLGVGGADVKVQSSRGSVAVSRADNEIDSEDINRAVDASRAVPLPPNRMVLHAITREFIVDGVGDIRDPLGMVGNKLEVNSLIIDSFVPTIKNLTKAAESAGAGIAGLILSPLASVRSVLTKNQRELGTALIDIGFGKTCIGIYEENKLLHTAIFPVGSGNITNDLAIGLKTSIPTAEMIKLSFGSALSKEASRRENIELQKIDSKAKGIITKKYVAEIIEVRLAEIFEFVNNELKRIGKNSKLPGGAVLVGGGSKLPGIVELAKQELRLPAQIGVPDLTSVEIDKLNLGLQPEDLEDPEYACALGLLMSGNDRMTETASNSFSIKDFFKKAIGYFLP